MLSKKGCCLFFILGVASWTAAAPLSDKIHVFADIDSEVTQIPCLPTPNKNIYQDDELGFAARTRVNEQYGLPGWTRGNGGRFHKGVDILPTQFEKTDQTVRIDYYDPKTGRNFSVREPVLVPKDEIFAILNGTVVVANYNEERSGYGRYVMIQHLFSDGTPFITMYCHLNRLEVHEGDSVKCGQLIGWMGQTSSNPGGRDYLKAIPHCHFETGRCINSNFANTMVAKLLYPRMLGGKYDPRNIQPFNPIDFLKHFNAKPHAGAFANRGELGLRAEDEDSSLVKQKSISAISTRN